MSLDDSLRHIEGYFFSTLKKVTPESRYNEIAQAYRNLQRIERIKFLKTTIPEHMAHVLPLPPEEQRKQLYLIKGGKYGKRKGPSKRGAWNYRKGNDAA